MAKLSARTKIAERVCREVSSGHCLASHNYYLFIGRRRAASQRRKKSSTVPVEYMFNFLRRRQTSAPPHHRADGSHRLPKQPNGAKRRRTVSDPKRCLAKSMADDRRLKHLRGGANIEDKLSSLISDHLAEHPWVLTHGRWRLCRCIPWHAASKSPMFGVSPGLRGEPSL